MNNEEKTIMELDLDTIAKIVIYSTKNKDYRTILLYNPFKKGYDIIYENTNLNTCICGHCGCEIKTKEDLDKHANCEIESLTNEQTKNFINGIFNDSEIDDRTIIEIISNNGITKITKKL